MSPTRRIATLTICQRTTSRCSKTTRDRKSFRFERQTDLPITIAMLIDISGSQEWTLPEEKAAGQRFFRRVLRPKKDLAAVVTFEHESVAGARPYL